MTRKHSPTLALALVLILPAVLAASTPNQGARPWDSEEDGPFPAQITRAAKCRIEKIEAPHRVHLFDLETEKRFAVDLDETIPLTAQRKKEFDGRKKLAFRDLEEGQQLNVTYRVEDGRILRIKVSRAR